MSKESSLPLTRMIETEDGEEVIVDVRYRRYPVTDRKWRQVLNLSDDGHNVPPPSSRRNRRK